MGRTVFGGAALVVLSLACCQIALAEDSLGNPGWEACLRAPTRACLLEEALTSDLAANSPSASQLATIAEAQAAAGNVQAAFRIIPLIRPDQAARAFVLRSIASAQAKLGLTSKSKETFLQAHLVAETIDDSLTRAEAQLSIAKGETEAGLTAEAADTFAATLELATNLQIPRSSECVVIPTPEDRLASLLKKLAEQQAREGNIPTALQAARHIRFKLHARVEALRHIAETQAQRGSRTEAGRVLKEALEAAHASQTPQGPSPSCPSLHYGRATAGLYVDMLCAIAKSQATAGLIEDAAATLDATLQYALSIKDSSDFSRSGALSEIAEAQSSAGLKPQSAATFERAVQAASDVSEPTRHIRALVWLGCAQYRDGRLQEARDSFDEALNLARRRDRAVDRAHGLLLVVEAKGKLGLADDAAIRETLEVMRSIAEPEKPMMLWIRLAQLQDNAGNQHGAVAAYGEALSAVEAIDSKGMRTTELFNALYSGLGGFPGQPPHRRLIAETAPRILKMVESIGERRSEALVVVASAMSN